MFSCFDVISPTPNRSLSTGYNLDRRLDRSIPIECINSVFSNSRRQMGTGSLGSLLSSRSGNCLPYPKEQKTWLIFVIFAFLIFRLQISNSFDNIRIVSVPGDGHCLMYAWEIGLKASTHSKLKPNYEFLCQLIEFELLSHHEEYSNFLFDVSDFEQQVQDYVKEKRYSSQIGDIIINVLATVTSMAVFLYERDESGHLVQKHYQKPMRGEAVNGHVRILKTGEHYEPIVNDENSTAGRIYFHFCFFNSHFLYH